MKVGFPNWTDAVIAELSDAGAGPDRPYSPVVFTPADLVGFRVRTDDAEYRPTEEEVRVGPYGGSRWFLWEMPYPSMQPVRVYVSCEQRLGDLSPDRPLVQPIYLVRPRPYPGRSTARRRNCCRDFDMCQQVGVTRHR